MSAARPLSLDEFAEAAHSAGRFALDTEFMGEGRYRTLLCLIQLAVPVWSTEDDPILLLDPLAADFDGAALAALLADPAVEVVVHAGRQDVALLRRALETDVTRLFDTQVAAGFAGLGSQSSYDSLLREVLGVRLRKSASFTRWDARPLTDEQLDYARDDVVHLLDLAERISERLESLGRLSWALEECDPLTRASDERDPDNILRRLPRSAALSPRSRSVARELVLWREANAARHDRPVQNILGDPTLVEIARRVPRSGEQLERIRGVGTIRGNRGRELMAAVQRGLENEPPPTPERHGGPFGKPEDAPLVALAESLLRARALQAKIAYELLATRADLQAIVAALREGSEPVDARPLNGWRRELVGEELLRLLSGQVALAVADGGSGAAIQIHPLE